MRKILLTAMLSSIVFLLIGQQNVFHRFDAGTDNWWDNANPWYYQTWANNQDRPDRDWRTANDVFFGHNNNRNMVVNGANDQWYYIRTLTFQAEASETRTLSGTNDDAGFDLRGSGTRKIENLSTAEHILDVRIALYDGTAELNPINGDLTVKKVVFNNSYFLDVYGGNGKILSLEGDIQGSGGIAVKQNSIVQIVGDKTYSGGTFVEAGTLELQGSIASSGVTVSDGAKLIINGTGIEVASLTIQSGGLVEIEPGMSLTVNGTLTNNAGTAGLVIKSDATGTGSLIHSSTGVSGTMERFVPAHTSKSATGWHFLSSPVNNFAIGSSNFVPGGNDDFYAWDEGTNTWLNYKDPANPAGLFDNFNNGQGYLVAYQNDLPGIFTGTFNVGDIAVDLSLTSAKDIYNGWNLLGNPYPSAIDWSVVGNHTDTFEDVFAYVYNRGKTGGAGYEEIDGSQQGAFIPANQGFFVKTKASGSFNFTNDMRVHGSNFMKSSPADNLIVLRFAGDHYFDHTTLRLRKGSQFSRDPLDALKMVSFDTDVPQIYTVTTDQRGVAINSIPTVDESLVIPVGLVVPANGEMTITLKELSGEFENLSVLLHDQKTGLLHRFVNDQDGYTFDATTDDTDRFLLKFETVSVHELPAEAALHIYAHGSTVYLNSRESLDARIAVYNITGQQVHGQRMTIDGLSAINLNLPTGWYVVSVTTDKEMATQKVFIR